MKLNEKIAWYRRERKLSQEELAARVGVSRQAVSKWELGDALPDTGKLLALARAFEVTADHLLDDSEEPGRPDPAPPPPQEVPPAPAAPGSDLPGVLGRMVRRWGWLAGVYLALQGLGITLVGGIARYMFTSMFQRTIPMDELMGAAFGLPGLEGLEGGEGLPTFTVMSDMGRVFVNVATVVMAVGVFVAIAGVALAITLRVMGRRSGAHRD